MALTDFISEFPDKENYKQKFKKYRKHFRIICLKYDSTQLENL